MISTVSHKKITAKELLELLKREKSRLISAKIILDKKDKLPTPIKSLQIKK